jgi:hypothetical protein
MDLAAGFRRPDPLRPSEHAAGGPEPTPPCRIVSTAGGSRDLAGILMSQRWDAIGRLGFCPSGSGSMGPTLGGVISDHVRRWPCSGTPRQVPIQNIGADSLTSYQQSARMNRGTLSLRGQARRRRNPESRPQRPEPCRIPRESRAATSTSPVDALHRGGSPQRRCIRGRPRVPTARPTRRMAPGGPTRPVARRLGARRGIYQDNV